MVVNQCMYDLQDISVQNINEDAWAGTISVTANGEEVPLTCDVCGGSPFDNRIVVDGNADSGNHAPTICFDGRPCTLTLSGKTGNVIESFIFLIQ